MQIAVLSSAILAYALVMMLFWRRVRRVEHMEGRVGQVARLGAANTAEANDLNKPFTERFLKPTMDAILNGLSNLMPQTENPRLANDLKMAGYKYSTGEYYVYRLVVAVVVALLASALGVLAGHNVAAAAMGLIMGAAAALVFLRFSLKSAGKKRKQAIQKQLPEVLDLLSVNVEAGLGFDAAMQRISDRAKGVLVDELVATYLEITLGRPRSEALRNFEQRCGLEEVKSFVAAIVQAEQLGIALKSVLKSQAQQMRLLRRQRVEEKAMKAPVKIIIPLVVFVFPVLFIILLGPVVLNLIGMGGIG